MRRRPPGSTRNDTLCPYTTRFRSSGLYEAKLGREEYGGEVATYCAGYKEADLPEIAALSDHLIFNSPGQIARFRPLLDRLRAEGASFDIGIRITPLHRDGEVANYDPAATCSRPAFPISQLTSAERLVGKECGSASRSRWARRQRQK